ncbi:GntR family transcriptional regulator [Prolixibacteraceae bacterium JC049]|nr:GntR family transcriptional regulator [Prolixibacteraceae bacterium JC049]
MTSIGKVQTLRVAELSNYGVYLDGDELGNILLPNRYVPENTKVKDEIEVFIYRDSEDRLVATTETPKVEVDGFALLKVVSISTVGAFMDWGLQKDLLVPYREQQQDMEVGKSYFVKVYLDDASKRIVGSSKIHKFLNVTPIDYTEGQEVEALITHWNEIGYQAIINGQHRGMLYKNELYKMLRSGRTYTAYVKKIREDEKIDLSLDPIGYIKIDSMSQEVLDILKEHNGFLAVNDKSSPEQIKLIFGISKKNFKKSIGALYKQRIIQIDEDGIRLLKKG